MSMNQNVSGKTMLIIGLVFLSLAALSYFGYVFGFLVGAAFGVLGVIFTLIGLVGLITKKNG